MPDVADKPVRPDPSQREFSRYLKAPTISRQYRRHDANYQETTTRIAGASQAGYVNAATGVVGCAANKGILNCSDRTPSSSMRSASAA